MMLAQLRSAYAAGLAQLRSAYEPADAVAPTILTTALPAVRVGQNYAQAIQMSGSPAPVLDVSVGALPDGLALLGNLIAGAPSAPGLTAFTLEATNSGGSDTQALSILVPNEGAGGDFPLVTTVTLVPALSVVDVDATVDLTVTVEDQNGQPIANLSGVITVSAGISAEQLAPTSAIGTATIRVTGGSAGQSTLRVAFDGVASNTATVAVSATTQVAPTITTTSLASAMAGLFYTADVEVTGDEPITLSLVSGALPSGMTLSGRTISGLATTAQTASFTLRATNATGSHDRALSIVVAAASVVNAVTVAPGQVTMNVGTQTQLVAYVTGSGGYSSAVTWTVESGGGTVSASGMYLAPAGPTTAIVRATSVQDATKYAEASITVQAVADVDALRAPALRLGAWIGSSITLDVTVLSDGAPAADVTVSASSSDPNKVTITPTVQTDLNGVAAFDVHFVAGGRVVLSLAAGALTAQIMAVARTG